MRSAEIPEVLQVIDNQSELPGVLLRCLNEKHLTPALMLAGTTGYRILGSAVISECGAAIGRVEIIRSSNLECIQTIESRTFFGGYRSVVALGGGKVIDAGKIIAERLHVPVIAIPTQVSHDGIASPVAVIEDGGRRKQSMGATLPMAVLLPLDIVRRAPLDSLRAGVGDLIGNLSALHDWRTACRMGLEGFDDYAALLSEVAVSFVVSALSHCDDLRDRLFVRTLTSGLILSGIAMSIAGSSRPCSGAEHLISHAIDATTGGVALHGIQVALGTLTALYYQRREEELHSMASLYRRFGLPTCPSDLGLSDEAYASILRSAPGIRPGRYTVLSELA